MVDYPKNQLEFEKTYGTEESCQDYLWELKLAAGFTCKECGYDEFWRQSRNRLTCKHCRTEASALSGTVFHKSHVPLAVWFRAVWWFTNQKHGVSALGLQRALGIGSYRTSWLILQKLRRAMIRPDREKLSGEVEVDEFYLGGTEGNRKIYLNNKLLVLAAVEKRGEGIGRIRLKHIPSTSWGVIIPGVLEMVEAGSTIDTDGWCGYMRLSKNGYRHNPIEKAKTQAQIREDNALPRVHRVASLFKRWVLGTYQGRVDKKHFHFYLEEFVFRFNRRTSRSRGLLFLRLLENAVKTEGSSYKEIIKPNIHI